MNIEEQLKRYRENQNIIPDKVSNMKSENGTVELRIISARQPLEHARLVRPNLEDVFLYYFGEKGGDME